MQSVIVENKETNGWADGYIIFVSEHITCSLVLETYYNANSSY